jgi:guanylate kinase
MVITEQQRGLLFVLVGPGGAGKNTLITILTQRIPTLQKLVTATTRSMRANEVEGIDHYFVSLERFHELLAQGELLEHTEVTPGKFYGILSAPIERALSNAQSMIADIDVMGARILRASYPNDVILIFLTVAGSTDEERLTNLRRRMEERGEAPTLIEERLERARSIEFPFASECEYVVVNADHHMDAARQELEQIIRQRQEQRKARAL